jgi:hypothetical protein
MSGNTKSLEQYAEAALSKMAPLGLAKAKEYWVLVAGWETDAFETPKVGTLVYAVFERKPTMTDLLEVTSNVITDKDAIRLLYGQTIVNSEGIVFDLYVWSR